MGGKSAGHEPKSTFSSGKWGKYLVHRGLCELNNVSRFVPCSALDPCSWEVTILQETQYPSSQFYGKPKTALKNKSWGT